MAKGNNISKLVFNSKSFEDSKSGITNALLGKEVNY